jgi:hypothetical protein
VHATRDEPGELIKHYANVLKKTQEQSPINQATLSGKRTSVPAFHETMPLASQYVPRQGGTSKSSNTSDPHSENVQPSKLSKRPPKSGDGVVRVADQSETKPSQIKADDFTGKIVTSPGTVKPVVMTSEGSSMPKKIIKTGGEVSTTNIQVTNTKYKQGLRDIVQPKETHLPVLTPKTTSETTSPLKSKLDLSSKVTKASGGEVPKFDAASENRPKDIIKEEKKISASTSSQLEKVEDKNTGKSKKSKKKSKKQTAKGTGTISDKEGANKSNSSEGTSVRTEATVEKGHSGEKIQTFTNTGTDVVEILHTIEQDKSSVDLPTGSSQILLNPSHVEEEQEFRQIPEIPKDDKATSLDQIPGKGNIITT